MKKIDISKESPTAKISPLGDGRYILNDLDGVACTLTGVHFYAGHITHPRGGYREMGVLEVYEEDS